MHLVHILIGHYKLLSQKGNYILVFALNKVVSIIKVLGVKHKPIN
jgi:hypothetical protein